MKKNIFILFVLSIVILAFAAFTFLQNNNSKLDDLTGTWKAKVQFKTGAFAGVKDLEFLLSFNSGGTMN